jgi:GH24 family phage-related lysozyme (muramidase)
MTLYNDLKTLESAEEAIYSDHVGVPTIGVGYNLRNADVLKAVLLINREKHYEI